MTFVYVRSLEVSQPYFDWILKYQSQQGKKYGPFNPQIPFPIHWHWSSVGMRNCQQKCRASLFISSTPLRNTYHIGNTSSRQEVTEKSHSSCTQACLTAYFSIFFFQYSPCLFDFRCQKPTAFLAKKLAICKYVIKPGRNWNPKICYKKLGNRVRLLHADFVIPEIMSRIRPKVPFADDSSNNWSESHINWFTEREGLYSCILPLGVGFTSWAILCVLLLGHSAHLLFWRKCIWTRTNSLFSIFYEYLLKNISCSYSHSFWS